MPKTVIYWDSCMFYEVLGKELVDSSKKAAVDEILSDNEKDRNIIITSVITHLEVLPEKLNEKGAADEADYMAQFDGVHFLQIDINANVLLRAREIRNFYYVAPDENGHGAKMMDLGDAIHLASATIFDVDDFHTRDNKKKKGNIPLLDLNKSTANGRLCGKYDLKISSPQSPQAILDV